MVTRPGALPAPRSYYAPYFSGQPGDSLVEFLRECDDLASSLGFKDTEKVDIVLRYVPASIREFWQTLDGYLVKNWRVFRSALEDLYPDTMAGNRYTRTGLQEFVKISARTRIQDEDDLILYHRRFLQISNPLRLAQQLSDEERNAEFFNGFHPKDRDIIYDRLFTLNPRRATNRAPGFDETLEAVRGYFTRNQFHLRTAYNPLEDNPSSHEQRLMEQWFGKTPQDPRRDFSFQHNYGQYDHDSYHFCNPAPQRPNGHDFGQDDLSLGNIISRMHGLSTRDATYAVLYAQCMQRFPAVAEHLEKPEMFRVAPTFTFQASPSRPQRPVISTPPSTTTVPVYQPQNAHPQLINPSPEAAAFFCTQPQPEAYTLKSPPTFDASPVQVPVPNIIPSHHDTPPLTALRFEAICSKVHMMQTIDTSSSVTPEEDDIEDKPAGALHPLPEDLAAEKTSPPKPLDSTPSPQPAPSQSTIPFTQPPTSPAVPQYHHPCDAKGQQVAMLLGSLALKPGFIDISPCERALPRVLERYKDRRIIRHQPEEPPPLLPTCPSPTTPTLALPGHAQKNFF